VPLVKWIPVLPPVFVYYIKNLKLSNITRTY